MQTRFQRASAFVKKTTIGGRYFNAAVDKCEKTIPCERGILMPLELKNKKPDNLSGFYCGG